MQNFEVKSVKLEGNNLIEASAGTGKTYSVGILVLRLLIEKSFSVKEILMVTFTDAAVEELKARIRVFIYQAWQYSKDQNFKIEEAGIKEIIDERNDLKEVSILLNESILLIDEISIFTIHGFCTRTLKEFAFETNQNFDLKMMADQSEIHNAALNTVWRNNITTLPVEILNALLNADFSQLQLQKVVKTLLDGRVILDELIQDTSFKNILSTLTSVENAKNEADSDLKSYILDNETSILNTINTLNKGGRVYKLFNSTIQLAIDDLYLFSKEVLNSNQKDRFDESLLEGIETYFNEVNNYHQFIKTLSSTYYYHSALDIIQEISAIKSRRNVQSFNDLIENLHLAVTSANNERLVYGLQQKYKAVFIDEFQDTDKLQYEIFSTLFEQSDSVIFYIGDPKQSIYAFRKADLDTYKLARSKANCFTMNTNFRSNQWLLSEFNTFFSVPNPFNDEEINYQEVSCGKPKIGYLANEKGEQVAAFDFFDYQNKNDLNKFLVDQILKMLTNPFQIIEKGASRYVKASDIGILVRGNNEGRAIKLALGQKGIPAVVVDDSKIFQSDEVNYIIYILQAINDISANNINKALGTPLFLDYFEDIAKINHDAEIVQFELIKNIFVTKGVYAALHYLLDIYNLRNVLLQANHKRGNRVITNVLHIVELLHKEQSRLKLSLEEMIEWLSRARNGGVSADSNFEQRLESDENSVNIVTVHKSKGLAYNIVFVPYLDKSNEVNKDRILEFKNDNNYAFVLDNSDEKAKELYLKQADEEAKRLIYVALTRAVYYCAIYGKEKSKSPIAPFIQNWKNQKTLIKIDKDYESSSLKYVDLKEKPVKKSALIPARKEITKKWSVLSYSSIATHSERYIPVNIEEANKNELDNFVFNKMPRGANFGNFIHHILENINFSDATHWDKKIQYAGQKYLSWSSGIVATQETELKLYLKFFEQICNTEIQTPSGVFQLSQIVNKLSEMQFYFDYKKINLSSLKTVLTQHFELEQKLDIHLEGIMNGFIDLVFEHEGKYYILDWKTNYLGNNLEAYNQENLLNAMTINNYHLQYMVYTVALVRYLRTKLLDFNYDQHFGGVLYLFVRGVRTEQSTGVYFNRLTEHEYVLMEKLIANDLEIRS